MATTLASRRILLIHPLGYNTAAAQSDISRKANIMPPIGLLSMAAWLEHYGFTADVIDFFAHPDARLQLKACLQSERPAFVGFSCTTSSFLDGVLLAREIRRVLPRTCIIFGGPHVSALREPLLKAFPVIDILVVGEGEETLRDIMATGSRYAEGIPGTVARTPGGEIRFAGFNRKPLDLDALPFPAYEKLQGYPHSYPLPIFSYPRAPGTSCISSRGCPYSCSYCDRSVFGRSFRFNSAEYLYDHMRHLRRRFGIRHINFYDDQFTFHRGRIAELTDRLRTTPLGMTFNCAVRAEHVDDDLLERLRSAGCWMVSLGIENADEELLSRHRRNVDMGRMADTVRRIKGAGLRVKALLMMGLPGETQASIRRTREFAFSLPIDEFNLAKFTPFPGAPLYETIRHHGTFEEDWPLMDCMHFLFIPKGMSRDALEALHVDFYRSHYMRPRVWWSYFTMAWKSPHSWLRMLADSRSYLRFIRSNRRR